MTEPKIDKRTLNGNNGTRRGKDKKPRKKRTHCLDHKPEVKAGMAAKTAMVFEFFGGIKAVSVALGVPYMTVYRWKRIGLISPDGAAALQRYYKRNNGVGFRAAWVRPDLKFDANGKPLYKSPYSMNKRYMDKKPV